MRGAAGEGEEEDAFGGHPPFYKVGDAVHEGPGLPGAGAGDDEEGPVAVGGGSGLFAVQLRGQVAGGGVDTALTGGIDQGRGGSDVARGQGGAWRQDIASGWFR